MPPRLIEQSRRPQTEFRGQNAEAGDKVSGLGGVHLSLDLLFHGVF
jgi:hypothetical protein